MAKTVAIYQDLPAGRIRFGLFTYRGRGQSVYAISQAFHAKFPHAYQDGSLYISKRIRLNGQWTDDSLRLPMDPPASNDPDWKTFCKRTNDPKLRWIEAKLTEMHIPHRRHGDSWHAPILEVPRAHLEQAEAFLLMPFDGMTNETVDDIPDDASAFDEYL